MTALPGGVVKDAAIQQNLDYLAKHLFNTPPILELAEQEGPSAPASNRVRLYAKDNGAGKTQLIARFATGAEQVIATEP